MFKYSKPFGSDKNYKRPEITYQEQLSKEEVLEKLNGYVKVDNISEVPISTHVRYFTKKDDKIMFRTGGSLVNKNNADVYVMLSNGTNTWSVQVRDTVFYRKMSHQEELNLVKNSYEKKIKEQTDTINQLKTQANPHRDTSSDTNISIELVDKKKLKK